MQALRRHDWVVYAKTPLAGPAAVLDYLARYTHRTAIGNERLVAIAGDKVLLRVRADDTGGKRVIAMPGEQFIGRLLQHVLPPGFKRIRHYGLLAPAAKTERLALARKLLAMPPSNPQAREDAQAFMRRVAAIEIESLPALQARALARRRAARRRPRGHRSAHAGRVPRAAVTRTRRPTALAWPARTHGPRAFVRRPRRSGTPMRPSPRARPTPRHLRRRCATSALPRSSMQRTSALPAAAAETYTAHSTAAPAVQSNEVYPTPCTTRAFDQLGRGVR